MTPERINLWDVNGTFFFQQISVLGAFLQTLGNTIFIRMVFAGSDHSSIMEISGGCYEPDFKHLDAVIREDQPRVDNKYEN